METPSSIRRVTRSQALASATSNSIPISRKPEDSDGAALSKSLQRNRKVQDSSVVKAQDRSALIDITNDSPIVGLASGNVKTPISSVTKQRNGRPKIMMTPGSGEALLRGQVKTLLQKVEEEAELSKISLESRPFIHLQGVVNSPAGLLAPTPANTPLVSNMSIDEIQSNTVTSVTSNPIKEELLISQVVSDLFDGKNQETNQITRSLLLDFSEKSELSDSPSLSSDCTSVLTQEQGMKEDDSDNASIWSIQVNASTHDEEEEDEEVDPIAETDENEEEDEVEEEEDEGLVDELCNGLRRINVNENGKAMEFAGKHTRFRYDSDDDELMIEEIVSDGVSGSSSSPSVVRLKGLPTPIGKHLRFPMEDEEDED